MTESQKTVFISKIFGLELPPPTSKTKFMGCIKDGVREAKISTKQQIREIAKALRRFVDDMERQIEE